MQEESKSQYNKKSLEGPSFFNKTQNKHQKSWSLKHIFSCCRDTEPEIEPLSPPYQKKHANSVTTHYSNRGPASFINTSKHLESSPINLPENTFPFDTAFLLGKGPTKIICKISKVVLALKSSSNASEISSQSKNTCFVPETNQSKKFDLKSSDNPEMVLPELKTPGVLKENVNFTRHQIFSMYFQGIQVEKSDWSEITPEVIAQHIAKKLKGQIIIDAMSGYGGNTIQFAKQCPYVIGVEIEGYKIKKAKHNSGIYKVDHKIDFIHADFFSLRKLRADVVFLDPSELPLEGGKAFSLEKNLSPNLNQLIRHSLSAAESICLLLPPSADIEEIGQLFGSIFNENPKQYNNMNYSIQIDQLYIDENFVSMLVHLGGNNNITLDEQRDVLFTAISVVENPSWRAQYPQTFVRRLFSYVGIQRSLMIISSIEEDYESEHHLEDTVFDVFIDSLKEKKIVTAEIIQQLHQDSESPIYSFGQSASKFHKLLGWDARISGVDAHSDLRNGIDIHSKNRSCQNKNMGHSFQSGKGTYETPKGTDGGHTFKGEGKNSAGKGGQPHSSESDIKELNSGSLEVSDIAVSSYSMKSAALLDSDSENLTEYRLSVMDDNENEKDNESPEINRSGLSKKAPRKVKVPTKRDKGSLVETTKEKNPNQETQISGNYNKILRKTDA